MPSKIRGRQAAGGARTIPALQRASADDHAKARVPLVIQMRYESLKAHDGAAVCGDFVERIHSPTQSSEVG